MSSPVTELPTTAASTLYFGPWYRRSPFFEKTLAAGCSAYDIYNHMYLPGYYADPVEEYWALLNDVTVWDVSVERIVEITGSDASAFTNSLTSRDLTKCAVGQGKYMIVTAEDGGIVNDPVLLRIEENRWWMALADSDAGLWARGVAIHSGLDVTVREPEVYPIQVQGPKSRDTMRTVFGPQIDDIKYYWTLTTEVDGIPVVISRTGWTGEVGYEIYLRDPSRGGDLWDRVMEAGKPHKIRPIAPCEARRIEAGIFNYGSDITINDTPFHVMGLERLVEVQDADYIGKAALEEIRVKGVDRKLVGIEVDGEALPFELSRKCVARHDGEPVGTVTDLIWSPRLNKNIGYVWVPIGLSGPGNAARDRGARRRALAGPDRGHPVPRPEEGGPAGLTLAAPPRGTVDRPRLRLGLDDPDGQQDVRVQAQVAGRDDQRQGLGVGRGVEVHPQDAVHLDARRQAAEQVGVRVRRRRAGFLRDHQRRSLDGDRLDQDVEHLRHGQQPRAEVQVDARRLDRRRRRVREVAVGDQHRRAVPGRRQGGEDLGVDELASDHDAPSLAAARRLTLRCRRPAPRVARAGRPAAHSARRRC